MRVELLGERDGAMMSALALALALAAQSPLSDSWSSAPAQSAPSWYRPWRLVERPGLHVGVRPAFYATSEGDERAVGCSVQVTR